MELESIPFYFKVVGALSHQERTADESSERVDGCKLTNETCDSSSFGLSGGIICKGSDSCVSRLETVP